MKVKKVILKPYDKDKFELVEDYTYKLIKIPKGFKTNGADIPRIFWSIFPPNSPEYLSAIVVHDYLCDTAVVASQLEDADKIFKEALMSLGVSKIKANIFYLACRAFHKCKITFKFWYKIKKIFTKKD